MELRCFTLCEHLLSKFLLSDFSFWKRNRGRNFYWISNIYFWTAYLSGEIHEVNCCSLLQKENVVIKWNWYESKSKQFRLKVKRSERKRHISNCIQKFVDKLINLDWFYLPSDGLIFGKVFVKIIAIIKHLASLSLNSFFHYQQSNP